MVFAKILDFLRMLKTRSRAPTRYQYKVLVMTEKVKTNLADLNNKKATPYVTDIIIS